MKKIVKKFLGNILSLIARIILWRTKPRIIAITGSVGKTSIKDAVFTIFKDTGSVRKSEKTFHDEIGVPLTIIGVDVGSGNPFLWIYAILYGLYRIVYVKKYPKNLVLEVGVHMPGDMMKLAKWLRPNVVVLTRLPKIPAHIELFPTLDSLIQEKLSLARALRKDGTLILNCDDEQVMSFKEELKARTVTYGLSEDSMIRGSNIQTFAGSENDGSGGLTYKVDFDGKSFPVVLNNIYSESFVSVSLAALSVAYACELNMVNAISALQAYNTPAGRLHIINGMSDSVIIDDTYNSSPTACLAGLRMLGDFPLGKRKIAILGDMLELGKHTDEEHKKIGEELVNYADVLIAVGLRGKNFAVGAREGGMNEKKIAEVTTAEEAGEVARKLLKKNDVVFVKGSQVMRMEKTVKMLMAEPDRSDELLVRQEKEWINK